MSDIEQQARDIMGRIRRQVFRPDGTTVGSCANGCGEYARGAGTCADCLAHELDDLIDSSAGTNYVYACEAQRLAERAVLAMAGGGAPVNSSGSSRVTAPPSAVAPRYTGGAG